MQNRNMSIEEFIDYAKQIKLSEQEKKEINSVLKKVVEIKNLRNETNQKKSNYNYFKRIMLPSDYTKINSDLKQQREYKVERERYKYEMKLKAQGITQEEIKAELEKYREKLYKQYGLSAKGRRKNIVTDEEAASLEDLENDNFEMEEE